ncbi:MAG: bifunctional histidinol-phosphatase/imidazoleglycerol-phosphate dehydratase, partial [Duncaniella sp.]|nr:bifunctional histidinol-phosphatase/imidazoleglycerol-phosphate dehydratase [Duncaniella sp.]
DHMLSQLPHHGGFRLDIVCRGDLDVDEHHTMEDVAIALGDAVRMALGDKRGIERYGFVLPMDDCRAMALIDLGGRIDFCWDVEFTREMVGDTPTEMYSHFFASFAAALRANLHISARGGNNHHLAEAVFKAVARALRMAVRRERFSYSLPSSKGVL